MKKTDYSQFIGSLYSEAKRGRWKRFYDNESDSFFWTKRPIPSGNRLAKVAKEIAFYLDDKGVVNGLLIQPFRNNFLSHNEEIADVLGVFATTNKIPPGELKAVESLLSASIQKDIYRDIAEEKYSLKDLNRFLTSVSR